MQLGDRSRFAIQWEFDAESHGHLLLGRICYWVGGVMIGEYSLGTALSDVLMSLAYPVGDCGNRESTTFCHLGAKDAFSLLHRGLFESEESLVKTVNDECWARFDVSVPVDVFDGYRLYLYDCELESMLLVGYRRPEQEQHQLLLEQKLKRGEFDDIIVGFQAQLEAAAIRYERPTD